METAAKHRQSPAEQIISSVRRTSQRGVSGSPMICRTKQMANTDWNARGKRHSNEDEVKVVP